MGKRVTFLALGAVMMVALLSFGSPAVWAAPPVGISTDGGGKCWVLNENGDRIAVAGSDVKFVITQSANCNVNATCKTEIEREPGPAVTWNQNKDPEHRQCRIESGSDNFFTDQWQETLKPNGEVSMSCHYRGGCPD